MSDNEDENTEEYNMDVIEEETHRTSDFEDLIEYEDIITENSKHLTKSFGKFFESDYEFNDLSKLWENIRITLEPEFEDIDDLADVVNALVNTVQNLDSETVVLLREKDASEELVKLLKELNFDYGYRLDRQFNRLRKGRNWWSNIKTNAGFRSQRPTFEHELTIDYSETVVFNSSPNTTLILINHFAKQLESAPELVGEDVLLEMNKGAIQDVIDRLEKLEQDINDYEEEIDQIGEMDSEEDSEESSDTSEDQ